MHEDSRSPRTRRIRLTYANVVATIAVAIALSTSAFAAATITGKQVKNGSLTGADIKNSSLTTSDLKNSTVAGADVKSSTLNGTDVADGGLGTADLSAAARKALLPNLTFFSYTTPTALTGSYVQLAATTVVATAGDDYVVRANIRALEKVGTVATVRCRVNVDAVVSPEVDGESWFPIAPSTYGTMPLHGTTGTLTAGEHVIGIACRLDSGTADMYSIRAEVQQWSGTPITSGV